MSNEWNWHVNSLQTRLNDLQSTIDSIKACVERRPGLDSATKAIAALIEPSSQSEFALQEFPMALSLCLADPAIGSLLVGPKGEVVMYNATAEVLLGRDYMLDRSVAGDTSTIQFSTEDRSRRFNPDELPWNRALKGETLPDMRLHVNKNASPESWINVSATPFRSAQGNVTGAVVFLIDTTEEVQLEGSITTLCDTIHNQIAQVGTTHDQLRDLADRLSNTGIQRILADIGGAIPPPREEDPTRKKSVPRRDAGVSPSTARESVLPKPVQLKHKDAPPLPKLKPDKAEPHEHIHTPETDQAESGTWAQVQKPEPEEPPFEWPPAPRAIAPADALQVQPPNESHSFSISGSEHVEAEPLLPVQTDDASSYTLYQEPQESIPSESEVLEVSQLEPDSGADETATERTADPSNHDNRFLEATLEANPIDINEARKHFEAEAAEAMIAPSVVEPPSQQDPALEQLPDTTIVETQTPPTQPPSWSTEYAPIETPAVLRGTNQDTTPIKPTSTSDEVVDSAKSLFGKFANLTKDSAYSDNKTDEKEPDPALPWPELVDGMNYGDPLWDEYTQSEGESTPWQQDAEEVLEDGRETAAPQVNLEDPNIDFSALEVPDQDPFAPIDTISNAAPSFEYVPEPGGFLDATSQKEEYAPEQYVQEYEAPVQAEETSLSRSKPRASASYNKLKPLSAAAELTQPLYQEEALTEPEVSYVPEESVEVEEGPRRVLVVDDIPVNQKLLLLHLKRLGYEADVASNGQEALEMLSYASYQLILMDCDMPVMDGFEAASRIRANEASSQGRIPIIALTSYDREGDKEKCIASGMDDYITKGASQKELKETIDRAFANVNQVVSAEGQADDSELSPPDIAAMLKLYGREEVEEVSRLFLSNMGTYIECMQLSIDEKNPDSVVHFANAVKGPCAALGMRLMTRLTTDIMAYAEAQDWTQVRVKYMRLKAVFVQTREELKKVCPDDSLLAT